MSNSNVIYLRKWFEKTPPLSEQRNCFASTRETLELLKAFSRIESAFLRGTIISAAREAAFAGSPRAAKEFGLTSRFSAHLRH
jgi:hypothetical protein